MDYGCEACTSGRPCTLHVWPPTNVQPWSYANGVDQGRADPQLGVHEPFTGYDTISAAAMSHTGPAYYPPRVHPTAQPLPHIRKN
ncbi:hypothetical protein FRC09_016747, partial [Ceratobasidium sp. 395]